MIFFIYAPPFKYLLIFMKIKNEYAIRRNLLSGRYFEKNSYLLSYQDACHRCIHE